MTARLTKFLSSTRIAFALLCFLFALTVWGEAQRRRTNPPFTGFSDVVFAIAFSPDGHTLAIARGASEPSQRFGRIELWDTETGKLRCLIKGFDGPVRSISFSPDGQTLVSASSEYRTSKIQEKVRSRDGSVFGELKWWDAQTGELKQKLTMPGDANSSISATYSPDGKRLAVAESFVYWSNLGNDAPFGASDPTRPNMPFRFSSSMYVEADLKLLDAQTGTQIQKLNASQFERTAFSPDGRLLASAEGDEVKLRDAQTGREQRKLKGFKGAANALAFSPDGRSLAVASTRFDHQFSRHFIKVIGKSDVKLFDVQTGKATLRLSNVGAVNSLVFEPGGRVLLIGGLINEGEDRAIPAVKLWNLQTGKSANFPTGGEDFSENVDSLALVRDGNLLAFRCGPDTVKMLDTQTWKVKHTWYAKSAGGDIERPTSRFLLTVKRVLAVAFSADGNTVSGETDQGEIKLWDPRTGEVKKQLANEEDDPSVVAVSNDGKSFAELSDERVRLWNGTSVVNSLVPLPRNASASTIALSPDGQTIAVANGNDALLLTPTGEVIKTLSSHRGAVDHLAFSDDGRMLACANEDGTIELWDVASSRIDRTIAAGTKVTALHFAPNGSLLAVAQEDHAIALWNLVTRQPQQKLQKHNAPINALAFSPDGQLLASGSDDRTVIIWETGSGKSKHTLKGHDQTVTSLAFSPDGRLLASGTGNAAVVLWDARTGKLSRVLR
jgi:WD40 repeat protein